jgi:hypothetical protein
MAVTLLITGYYRHPKMMAANAISGGELAETLWTRGLDYVNEQANDGFVPIGLPQMLTPTKTLARIKGLVGAGLWIVEDTGWRYHDFLDWNRTAEVLNARKAVISEKRAAAGKKGAEVRWQGRLLPVANSNGEATA